MLYGHASNEQKYRKSPPFVTTDMLVNSTANYNYHQGTTLDTSNNFTLTTSATPSVSMTASEIRNLK